MNNTQYISDHTVTAEEAVRKVLFEGANVVFGNAAAAPIAFSRAMYDLREDIPYCSVFHVLFYGEAMHLRPEMEGKIRPVFNFMERQAREAFLAGRAAYIPCPFHEVPALFEGSYIPDVAVISISLPDEEGYCSLGPSSDYTLPALLVAEKIVAELNPLMPRVGGRNNSIHLSKIDYIIPVEHEMPVTPPAPVGEVEAQIGKLAASLIGDGATLQVGIGAIPDAVLDNLGDRKDLGIHTELMADGVMKLIQQGVVTGRCKTLHPGKAVAAFASGTEAFYRFLNENDEIELYPVSYVNDPYVIGQNDHMVSINSALSIDLYGQLTAESIGYRLYSGSGGQVDFLTGAKRSKGGFSIIALPATAKGGSLSRIVPALAEGSVVTSSRNDVDYIVTEYGIARLRGKTITERAKALISIAAPQFRESLEKAAFEHIPGFGRIK